MKYAAIVLLASVLAGQVDSLSFEQKREYNRQKLSIEIIGQSIGFNPGIKGGTTSSTEWHRWKAYQGIDKQISEVEFFKLTGYIEESDKAKRRVEKIKTDLLGGAALMIGGMLIGSIPGEEETDEYGYTEITDPYIVPGVTAVIAGIFFWYRGMFRRMRIYTPASQAQEIADDYNQQLVNRIANEHPFPPR